MQYVEIVATVAAPDAERAASVLRGIIDSGVWLEMPFTQPDLQSDAIVDRSAPVRIHGYAPRGVGAPNLSRAASSALSSAGIDAQFSESDVAEEDWAESWKQHFHVERYGRNIVVVPSWRAYQPNPDDVIITLDPGMAFGTGQHETTRMCIEALEAHVRPGSRVLDVGCGSGILSIVAARLGATRVDAVDIDPSCVRITRENAQTNDVTELVHATCAAPDAPLGPRPTTNRADVVVANIIALVIIELATPLVQALAPGGRLIASGIIGDKEADVAAALTQAGARVLSSRWMADWRCIEAVRGQIAAS